MHLNSQGEIVVEEWLKTGTMRPRVRVDSFVVMPNHLHGILVIRNDDGRGTLQRAPTVECFGRPTSDSIPTMIRLFKSATTKRINMMRGIPGASIWQRNYYEHIIRDEEELNQIREYIAYNPSQWDNDSEYTAS